MIYLSIFGFGENKMNLNFVYNFPAEQIVGQEKHIILP